MNLERAMDPGFEPPEEWTAESLIGEEVERVRLEAGVALAAAVFPRRLGGDASPRELAVDKKLSRRVGQTFTVACQWYKADLGPWRKAIDWAASDSDLRRLAAERDWAAWWTDYRLWVPQRIARVATWGVKGGDRRCANRITSRLRGEGDLVVSAIVKTAVEGLSEDYMGTFSIDWRRPA